MDLRKLAGITYYTDLPVGDKHRWEQIGSFYFKISVLPVSPFFNFVINSMTQMSTGIYFVSK